MPELLFKNYIENLLVIISINSGSWGGRWLMIVLLEKETWVIGRGGTKWGVERGWGG
jgi:hypothetical protein